MVLKSFQEFISGYPDGDTESAKGMYASYLRDEQSFMQHEEFGSFDELNSLRSCSFSKPARRNRGR